MGVPSLQIGPNMQGAPHCRGASPGRAETKEDGGVPVGGHKDRGADTGVSAPPAERRPEPLSGDETQGACREPWPT